MEIFSAGRGDGIWSDYRMTAAEAAEAAEEH